jgi:hypothetical protein
MPTATASSRAAANDPLPQNAELSLSETASGEKGLFRYAPEPLLPRNTNNFMPGCGLILLRPTGLVLLRP